MAENNAGIFALQNQLGQQALDINEAKLQNFKTDTLSYNLLQRSDEQKASKDEELDVGKDLASVPKVYKTGEAFVKAGGAFSRGFTRGVQQAAAGLGKGEQVTAEAALLGSGRVFSQAGLSGIGAAAARGARGAGAVLTEAGEGSKLFATARFGSEGVTAVKDITGVEGIASRALLGSATSAAAEGFAKVGGKALGELGAGIDIGEDIDNLFNTGNAFKTVGEDGTVKTESTGEIVGNVMTIGAGILDVAAAFTGGALAPIAVAANIAAATESTAASIAADQKEKQEDSKDPPPSKPPAAVAPAAFAQLGLMANQSHNPINHITA